MGPMRTPVHFTGYNVVSQPRDARGGGVTLYVRAALTHKPLRALGTADPSEAVHEQLELGRNRLVVGDCYLPPHSASASEPIAHRSWACTCC